MLNVYLFFITCFVEFIVYTYSIYVSSCFVEIRTKDLKEKHVSLINRELICTAWNHRWTFICSKALRLTDFFGNLQALAKKHRKHFVWVKYLLSLCDKQPSPQLHIIKAIYPGNSFFINSSSKNRKHYWCLI